MRIAIKFDYATYLVCQKGADVGPLLQSLTGGIMCREEGYGKDRKYVPRDDSAGVFEIILLPDDSVSLPDAGGENPWIKALADARAELTNVQATKWDDQQKIKKLEEKLAQYTSID